MLSRGALTAVTTHRLVMILNKFIWDYYYYYPLKHPHNPTPGLCWCKQALRNDAHWYIFLKTQTWGRIYTHHGCTVCAKIKASKLQLPQESGVEVWQREIQSQQGMTPLCCPTQDGAGCPALPSWVPSSSVQQGCFIRRFWFYLAFASWDWAKRRAQIPQGLSSCFALQCLLKPGDKCRVILCSFERRDPEDVLATSSLQRRVLQPEGHQRGTSQTCHH